MQRMKDLGRIAVAAAATVLALAPQATAEDLLKVAIASVALGIPRHRTLVSKPASSRSTASCSI